MSLLICKLSATGKIEPKTLSPLLSPAASLRGGQQRPADCGQSASSDWMAAAALKNAEDLSASGRHSALDGGHESRNAPSVAA